MYALKDFAAGRIEGTTRTRRRSAELSYTKTRLMADIDQIRSS